MRNPERQAAFLDVLEDLRRHLQGRRAHECQVGAEFREGVCERMHRAAVLEVANQDDVLALERHPVGAERAEQVSDPDCESGLPLRSLARVGLL